MRAPVVGRTCRVAPPRRNCAGVAAKALKGCTLLGVGSSIPEATVSNDDLTNFVETNDEWITTRTGIRRRHVLAEGESITQHAIASAHKALEMAGVKGEDIDMILLATSSADDLFGSACSVQAAIGASRAVAMDLTAACSGFVLAVVTASQFLRTGARQRILVIGADALSRYVNWNDRGTCILFGDGAGAVVMGSHDGPCALLGMDMHSDGHGLCNLNAPMLPSHNGKALSADAAVREGAVPYQNIQMNGQEVFKFAVRSVPATLNKSLEAAGMAVDDIDWLVMHQANQRILDAAAKKLALPPERVVSNMAEYGNTSAASIPIALDEAVRSGRIADGAIVAIAGFGAGLTWGSAILRWR